MIKGIGKIGRFVMAAAAAGATLGLTSLHAQTLADALDTTNLVWTTGGDSPWFVQTTNTHDGVDAVRSGIVASNQTSWIETTVVGPATISYFSRDVRESSSQVHSTLTINGEYAFNFYIFPISQWGEEVYDLPVGTNVLHWTVANYSGSGSGAFTVLDQVNVGPPRPLAIVYQPIDQTSDIADYASSWVSAIGTPPYQYQWRKDGIPILNATNASLLMSSVSTNDAGVYSAVVSNSQGFVISSNATLTVLPPSAPTFVWQSSSQNVYSGETFSISAIINGSRPVTFQWRKNGVDLPDPEVTTWNSASRYFANASSADSGSYTILVTNAYGSVETTNAVITVVPVVGPSFTRHPRSLEVAAGTYTWLSAVATGDPEPQVSWRKVGEPPPPPPPPGFPLPPVILPPIRPGLLFTNASPTNAGAYYAVAKNLAGETNSRAALLTVLPAITNVGSWWQGAEGIFVTNNLAFLAQRAAGFSILDVGNQSAPVQLGGYNTPGTALAVAVANGRAFVADGFSGLEIYSVTNPFSPVLIGSYDTPGYAMDLVVRSNLVYVADSSGGLQVIDVTNPGAPTLAGSLTTNIGPSKIVLSGNLALLISVTPAISPGSNVWFTGFSIVDISNPAQPLEVGRVEGSFATVAVREPLAFVDSAIFDISNPRQPALVGDVDPVYPWSPSLRALKTVDGLLYSITSQGSSARLTIEDVHDPRARTPVGTYPVQAGAVGLFVVGNRVYVCGPDGSVEIIGTPFSNQIPSLKLSIGRPGSLVINGQPGKNCQIEFASQLSGAIWQTLQTILLTNQNQVLNVPFLPPTGFFRARQLD